MDDIATQPASTASDAHTEKPLACPKCGYDLRNLPAGDCPECGLLFDAESLRTYHDERGRHTNLGAISVAYVLTAYLLVPAYILWDYLRISFFFEEPRPGEILFVIATSPAWLTAWLSETLIALLIPGGGISWTMCAATWAVFLVVFYVALRSIIAVEHAVSVKRYQARFRRATSAGSD